MSMKFADITHMQLKKSLDLIHGQNSARSVNSSTTPIPNYMFNGVLVDTNVCSSQRMNEDACMSHSNCSFVNGCPELLGNNCYVLNSNPYDQCAPVPHSHCQVQLSNASSSSAPQSTKLYSIMQVKDAVLQDKESVIAELRSQIASLQHQLQEGDAALRKVVQSKMTSQKRCPPIPIFSGNQNLDVQAQKKINQLSHLLGIAESKLLEKSSQYKTESKEIKEKVEKLEARIKTTEQENSDLKKKQKSTLERCEKSRRRVECLERYLGDLPTIEDCSLLTTETGKLNKEKETLVLLIAALNEKLEEKDKTIQERDTNIEKLLTNESNLMSQISSLRHDLEKAKKYNENLGPNERDELEDLKYQVSRLQSEKEDAALMLSGCEKRLKQEQENHQQDFTDMQRKAEEGVAVEKNLRQELIVKQQTATKIHVAMKNLSNHNHQLHEQNRSLQNQVKVLETHHNKMQGVFRTCLRLQRETNGAVVDLKAVTQVLIQTAKGCDPNISALLGVTNDSICGDEDSFDQSRNSESGRGLNESEVSLELSNKRLIEVRKLRKEIDELRTLLSNHYAESMGNNCITQ